MVKEWGVLGIGGYEVESKSHDADAGVISTILIDIESDDADDAAIASCEMPMTSQGGLTESKISERNKWWGAGTSSW